MEVTRTDKVNAIIRSARNQSFSDDMEDIDLLSYKKKNINGEEEIFEERFDYIDTTSIHFICGTGYDNYSIPIEWLTDESIDRLYKCVTNK